MQVFVADPFCAAGLLQEIGVQPTGDAVRPARAEGYRLCVDADALRLALAPGTGAVSGVVLTPPADVAERAGFVMAAFGARPAEIGVQAGGVEVTARGFVADGDAPCGDDAVPDPAFLHEVIREVLGHHGRTPRAHLRELVHGIGFRALARVGGRRDRRPTPLGGGLGAADVELQDTEYPYAAYFGVEAMRLRHRRFDGGWSPPLARAVLASGDAVTVLPFDPAAGRVLLIEQFRAGPLARRDPAPWCLEAVAGRCDGLESTEDAARREAEEEAGLTLGRLERVAAYYPSPGVAAEFITAYVGEADLARAGGLHGVAHEHEDIRAIVVSLDEARAAVARGEVNNAPLLLTLLWLELNHARLAVAWRRPAAS